MNFRLFGLSIISIFCIVSCGPNKTDTNQGNNGGTIDYSLWDENQNALRKGTKKLDFYNLNDFHGSVSYDYDNSEPGINKLSTYFRQEKANNEAGFVLTSSGDMWQGSADSNITRGRLVSDWMNEIGFSAMALGNHEFDWTIDTIKSNQERVNFPFLASNIVNTDTLEQVDWVKPYTTITKNGVRIGIIGAIGEGITSSILATNVTGLTFADPTPYVTKYAKELREKGADVILYLLHDSIYTVNNETANAVDLIFGGHNHAEEQDTLGNKSIPAIEAWSNGKDTGHIELIYNFSDSKIKSSSGNIIDTNARALSSLQDDPKTKQIYDSYLESEISEVKNRVVGYTSRTIYSSEVPKLYNRYALQYFKETHDINNEYEIFAVETNNARSSIPSGDITYGDVYKSLPFDNCLCLIEITLDNVARYLGSYSSAHFYLPSLVMYVDGADIARYASGSEKVYILTIDYIAEFSNYQGKLKIKNTYMEEDALPRNIFSNYLYQNYPIR